jgi:UV DNA damage endonuclease
MSYQLRNLHYYGYPCMNLSLECTSGRTFRLNNFSEDIFVKKATENLKDILTMFEYDIKHGMMFQRLGSGIIPFATHSVLNQLSEPWTDSFSKQFQQIGQIVKQHSFRISFHATHFTILNSQKQDVIDKSIHDLSYHVKMLELMDIDTTHKIQLHTGTCLGGSKGKNTRKKEESMQIWINTYRSLPERIRNRLVLENDDTRYNFDDVYSIYKQTNIPILFDTYHHECRPSEKKTIQDCFQLASKTWNTIHDGIPMIDYSSKSKTEGAKLGKHADHIDMTHFIATMEQLDQVGSKYDVMLEIKDKETSAMEICKIKNEKRNEICV